MQQEIRFVVWGEPQGKGRPKFSRHGNYVTARTPEKTAVYENLVQMEYQRQCGDVRFSDTDSLQMDITAFYTIPASASRKRRKMMVDGEIRPTKKPDADNIMKVVADSLNQVAYGDDKQIVEARFRKWYAEQPRVEVCIRSMEG